MNSKIRKSTTPFGVIAFILLVVTVALAVAFSNNSHADNGLSSQAGRLITIHDRGNEKVILTKAATVGDAIKEAGISLDDKDAVEPVVSEKLVASDYQVNIYRARPVTIVDGNIRTKVITPYQTAPQIAESAGIILYDEDVATLGQSDDILADGAGLQLTITRATPFMLTLYGKTSIVRTQGVTVGEMLSEKGIIISNNDKVTPDKNTIITDGLAVKVWREGKQVVTVDEPIDFEIEKIKDANQPVSYHIVTTAGEAGLRSVSYEVTVIDGQEVGRTEIASITVKAAKKQVEIVGAYHVGTTPEQNEKITWEFLTENGFSREQTAGIMGNLMQEHRFNTTDTAGGYGIAQWMGGRRAELMTMPYPDTIDTQLEFLLHELTTNYSGAGNAIKSTNSVVSVVEIFQNQFERCNPYYCMQNQRLQYAYDILEKY